MTAQQIKAVREKIGLKKHELAQVMGVHYTTVYRWELGATQPTSYQISLLKNFGDVKKRIPDPHEYLLRYGAVKLLSILL